jgi:EAL domain-containing protein (putative c-di-GMP-specific phosphodiesterase class I)
MEPMTLALTAAGMLAPYLAAAGQAAAKKAGEAAWTKLEALYTAIRDNLTGNAYGAQALTRLTEQPQSQLRQVALADVLEEQLKADDAFAATLQRLVQEAKAAGSDMHIEQSLDISGQARDVTQIGTVGGNVDLRKQA